MTNEYKTGNELWNRNFILLCFNNLFLNIPFDFLIGVLPLYIMQTMHTNKSTVGVILSLSSFGGILMRPFTGITVDNYGRKIIFLVSIVVLTLTFNLYMIAGTIMVFSIVHFIHGMAWGSIGISGSTVLIDSIPSEKRGLGLGYHGMASSIASVGGPAIAIAIVAMAGYKTMFLCAVLLCLISLMLALLVKYPVYKPNIGKLNWSGLFEKSSLPLSFNFFISTITTGGLTAFIAIYAKERGGVNIGLYFTMSALCGILARWIGGMVINKKGPLEISTIALLFLASGFPVLVLLQSPVCFYASSLLFGTGTGILYLSFQTMVNNLVYKERRGAANATLFTILNIGYAIGKLVTGFSADLFTLGNTFLIFSVVNILSALFFTVFAGRHYIKNLLPENKMAPAK